MAGTPVKSCMTTRAGENRISRSGSAAGSQPASARTSSAVMSAPSSVRSRFSSSTLRLNGSRSAPSTAESRWISYDVSPTDRVPRAPKESALTMRSSFHSRGRMQQVGRTTVDGVTAWGRPLDGRARAGVPTYRRARGHDGRSGDGRRRHPRRVAGRAGGRGAGHADRSGRRRRRARAVRRRNLHRVRDPRLPRPVQHRPPGQADDLPGLHRRPGRPPPLLGPQPPRLAAGRPGRAQPRPPRGGRAAGRRPGLRL